MTRAGEIRWFVDENLRGAGNALAAQDAAFAIAESNSPLGVVRGMTDEDWLRCLAGRDIVVITQDRHIRTRHRERDLICEFGLRVVVLTAKDAMTVTAQVDLINRQMPRLLRLRTRLGPGPWVLMLTKRDVREWGIDCDGRLGV